MEHHFNTQIAKDYGIEEAILLHYFFFWIAKNAANNENFQDGLFWTFNTREAYSKFFEYMSESKIYRSVSHLVDEGLLVKGDYNKDRWKRPTWYALTSKGIDYLSKNGYDMKVFDDDLQNERHVCVKMNNRGEQNEQSILINKTYTNTYTNKKDKDKSLSKKDDENDFVERMYKLYPSKCPIRNTSLGKCSKDKDRIRKLLKTYSMDDIERMIRKEVDEKYGKGMMKNFSTFLNNFPDPNTIFDDKVEGNQDMSKKDFLIIDGQVYR